MSTESGVEADDAVAATGGFRQLTTRSVGRTVGRRVRVSVCVNIQHDATPGFLHGSPQVPLRSRLLILSHVG